MSDKQLEQKQEQPKTEVITYTKEQVDEMLSKQQEELRQKAVEKISEKNREIKEKDQDLALAGSDEFYNIAKWGVMKNMAEDMVKSGALPQGENAYTVVMKMQAGREMGLKPIESIKSFYIVRGVLTIFGSAVTRRLREHGWRINYKDETDKCTVTVTKGNEEYTDSLTFKEAEESKWTSGQNGLKPGWLPGANRKLKLRYGAVSSLIKTYLPDVLGSAADLKEVAEDTMPLYTNGSTSVDSQVTAEKASEPATDAQKENIRNLIGYSKMEAEDKDYNDEKLSNLTYGQAIQWITEITTKKKKK